MNKTTRTTGEHRRSIFGGKSLRSLTLVKTSERKPDPELVDRAESSTNLRERRLLVKNPGTQAAAQATGEAKNDQDMITDRNEKFQHVSPVTHVSKLAPSATHHPTTPVRRGLRAEIDTYLKETYLSEVYDDFLSSHGTRLYQPSHPHTAKSGFGPSSQIPKSRRQATAVLSANLAPLIPWYSLSSAQAKMPSAQERQLKITCALDKYGRERGLRLYCQKIEGSGAVSLYRNLPDVELELNIRMLLTRAHLSVRQGQLERADRLVNRALGIVDALGYPPLNAKVWYWKGLVADKCGHVKEAAEAFFYALECVGKYAEGDYLPKYVKVYGEQMLDFLRVEAEHRSEWMYPLQPSAEGIEPLHMPSPTELPIGGTSGLGLTPPNRLVPGADDQLSARNQDTNGSPSSEET